METKTPQEIAAEIGAPTEGLLGSQEWQSDLHTDLICHELHYADGGGCICFRVTNKISGVIFSKLPSEASPGDVDGTYSTMIANHQKVEFELKPALYAAVPDLDPEAPVVRGLMVGGKPMIADLINGQMQNVREESGKPVFTVDKSGAVQVDLSNFSDASKTLASAAVAQVAGVSLAVGAVAVGAVAVAKS